LLHLVLKVGERNAQVIQALEVRLGAGERTVSVSLPSLYDLVVSAPGLEEDSRLYLRPASDWEQNDSIQVNRDGRFDSEGQAVFRDLPAGKYRLRTGDMREYAEVTVPCGEFLLDTRKPDCMRVAIGDRESALYQAGLRGGDLIIGVDGVEYTNEQSFWGSFRGNGQDDVNLLVLRGDERLEIAMKPVPPAGDWWERLGGMLTPTTRP